LLDKCFPVFQKEHWEPHTQLCNVTSQKTRILILATCLLTNKNGETQSNTQVRKRMAKVVAVVVMNRMSSTCRGTVKLYHHLEELPLYTALYPRKVQISSTHGQSLKSCINHCLFYTATFILLSSCAIWFKSPNDTSSSICTLTYLKYSNPFHSFALG
jgi:hypothetical protein